MIYVLDLEQARNEAREKAVTDKLCKLKQKHEFTNAEYMAIPLPMMVFLRVKVDLPVLRASEIMPVHLGSILMLFLATIGIEICCI